VYYSFIFTWYQSKWFNFLSVLFVLLADGQWLPTTAGVKSFKDSCMKYLNVDLALLISVLSTAFSLLSIVCRRHLPAPSNSVHHYLKLPTLFFLSIQQCEPLFSTSAPLSAAFHRRRPPAIIIAVMSGDRLTTTRSGSPPQATSNPTGIKARVPVLLAVVERVSLTRRLPVVWSSSCHHRTTRRSKLSPFIPLVPSFEVIWWVS